MTYPTSVRADESSVRIGVLAKRGVAKCLEKWQPTAEYLTNAVPGSHFTIVPLGFEEIHQAIVSRRVDFILANPAFYIRLKKHYEVNRIVTLKNKRLGTIHTSFGGVIFVKAPNPDIRTIADLKKKRFMAVDERSFGGWYVIWRELKERGIDPLRDFASLVFGGSQDAVVYAVRDGKVDVGAVRTDTLERMADEGKINILEFKVINQQDNDESSFDFFRSTRLYPEWPFSKISHVSDDLAEKVAVALLQMQEDSPAAVAGKYAGWTIPLNYSQVDECLQFLRVPPYDKIDSIALTDVVRQYWPWLVAALVFLVFLAAIAVYMKTLNSRLGLTMKQLDGELSERKKAEARLQSFKYTLDQIEDCVFMFAPDTLKFFYVNQGGVKQSGYTEEELMDMTAVDVKPEFDEESFRVLIQPLQDGELSSLTFETSHWHRANGLFPVEVTYQYIVPEQGNGRFVAVVRDMSKRQKEVKEKDLLHSQLLHAQKLESVGQLAAGIAHEINTPIQYVGSNIEFLDEAFGDLSGLMAKNLQLLEAAKEENLLSALTAEMDEALEEADWEYLAEEIPKAIGQSRDGIKRVSTIVLAMKEFSHPGSKEKAPNDLNRIIKNTITVARNEWKYVADVKLGLEQNLPSVPCLSDEMGQVILNIIINAAHAVKEKLGENPEGAKGTIKVVSRHKDGWAEIRIADNGMGMSDVIKDKIFDPFFTTKEVGKGTGQGLSIALDVIVDKHGGTLTVDSNQGQGTTFIIRLPLAG